MAPGRKATRTAMMRNRMKKAGIMTLLSFSMPEATPKIRMAAVTATAAKCQGMEPKSTARAEKKPWASPARTEPVREPAAYRSTQPTTTE